MSEAHFLSGRVRDTARLILSHLVHGYGMTPESEIQPLLQKCHDVMDEMNNDADSRNGGKSCHFCMGVGYDANGLIHEDDCVLVLLRKEIQ